MSKRIYVDVGGTFTDCVIYDGKNIVSAKTPTMGHNLSNSILEAVSLCAGELKTDVKKLLRTTSEIRYATTIALNQLIQHRGPRLALLTTAGSEDSIYIGMGAQWTDGLTYRERQNLFPTAQKPKPLIPRELCVGVRERVDSRGQVIRPLDEEHLSDQIVGLASKGIQGFVVSLLWSFLNPLHEKRIREIIQSEFSGTYLESVPIILSSDVISVRGEYQRTMTAIIDGYLRSAIQDELLNTDTQLRRLGYKGSLLLVKNNGGVAEARKTTPVETYKGGPIAGFVWSMKLAKTYGKKIVTTDMGGTTFDVGVIAEGSHLPHEFRPIIDHWLIGANMLEVSSIGAGGGTIAWLNHSQGGMLELGPKNAGAAPGPAAYNLGGIEPTVTDADLVLGYLNPDSFAGGRKLSRERAIRAITERIARPLSIDVFEAAARIRRVVDELMGHLLLKETAMRGYDPREFTLFAFGGAGPVHCCDYARPLEPSKIVTFPFSAVFCAMGSSFLEHTQTFSHSYPFLLVSPRENRLTEEYAEFNQVVSNLEKRALTDIKEADQDHNIVYSLELDLKFGGQVHVKRINSPRLQLNSRSDVDAIYNAFVESFSRSFSPFSLYPEGGVVIETFILHATLRRDSIDLPAFVMGSTSIFRAHKGRRDVFWTHDGGWISTPVYSFDVLNAGNIIEGPAIIEGNGTSHALPKGFRLTLDRHLAGIIEKIS